MVVSLLVLAVSMATAAPPRTFEGDVRSLLGPLESHATSGTLDNRIGFEYASLAIAEDGQFNPIGQNRERLAAIAKVLVAHPRAYLQIEGHTGLGAPHELEQEYSEQRAQIVAAALAEDGVASDRLHTRGWGSRVARLAQGSYHPNAAAANAGFGWVEVFFVMPSFFGYWDDLEVPRRPSYYYISAEAELRGAVARLPTRATLAEGNGADSATHIVVTNTPKQRRAPPCAVHLDEATLTPGPLDDKPVLAFVASALMVATAFLLFELLSRMCALCAPCHLDGTCAGKSRSTAATLAYRAPRLLLPRFKKVKKERSAKVLVAI